jgi:hypothetical protein
LLIQVYTKNNVGLIVVSGSMVNLSSLYTVIFVMNALKDLNTIPQPDVLKIVDKIYMNTVSINLHVIVKMVINMDLNCKM